MPKVTPEYRTARRAEIADAAQRAFVRRGFQATSIADIVAETGLSAGAIYNSFTDKAEIVHEVAMRIVSGRVLDVQRLATEESMPPPGALIRVLSDGLLREVPDPGILLQVWGEAMTDPIVREFASGVLLTLRGAFVEYIGEWQQREHGLSPEAAAVEAESQAPLFMSAVQGLVIQQAILTDFDREAYLASVEHYLPR